MNIGKALKGIVRFAKENPEVALAVVGIASPKLVRKAAPVIGAVVAAVATKKVEREDSAGA